ncbi:MAG TPA: hypothetical protein VJQ59_07780, partial [Candidatus Sulfotelmatobacter sp.]|nr:hypothetical protein [Candidatus Sulfotelmatobacter sp.]
MRLFTAALLSSAILISGSSASKHAPAPAQTSTTSIFGFRDSAGEAAIESRFLAAPDAKLAEEHLR